MASAFSMSGSVVNLAGTAANRNFDSRLGPCGVAISVFNDGRNCCISLENAYAEQTASGSALTWQSNTASVAFRSSSNRVISWICTQVHLGTLLLLETLLKLPLLPISQHHNLSMKTIK